MKDDGHVQVRGDGRVVADLDASRVLAGAEGTWRLAPHVGDLMVLERAPVDGEERERPERAVRLAGTFDAPSVLAGILEFLALSGCDGALTVTGGGVRRILYFRRGVYLSGLSSRPQDRLGHILVRSGVLDGARRDQVIDELRHSERLGRALVVRGVLTTPQVYDALQEQARDIFVGALALPRGTFHLVSPLDMTEVPSMMRLDVRELLIEAMRRLDEEAREQAQAELRRSRPVAQSDLPDDGIGRIIACYNDALRRLFANVAPGGRGELRVELIRFMRDSRAYRPLFAGVAMAADGALDRVRLAGNVTSSAAEEPLTLLQLGLNELLFFGMFAAGDALPPEMEAAMQRDVADALQPLPRAVAGE